MARLNAIGLNSLFPYSCCKIPRLLFSRSAPESITCLRSDPTTPGYKGHFSLFNFESTLYKELTKVRSLDNKTVNHTMGAQAKTACKKPKREDFERIKDLPGFKEWKILVGPSDWDDHEARKEGAEKYRTQNLSGEQGPGVYELAIIISKSETMPRKLDSSSVCVVYVGKAVNVRTRLQQYGSSGAHLQNGGSKNKSTNCDTASYEKHGLFSKTFSRDHGIAYRWVPMNSKETAATAEKPLLETYDYAWNKERNGPRREEDIWKRLERPPKSSWFSRIKTKLGSMIKKKVGC